MNLSLVIKFLSIVLLVYLLVVIYVYVKQRSLLYLPNIDNYDDELLTIDIKKIFIQNSEGINLR